MQRWLVPYTVAVTLALACTTQSAAHDDDVGDSDDGRTDTDSSTSTSGTTCVPTCGGKVCGADGCGGTCGECPDELTCNEELGRCEADGECVPIVDCTMAPCNTDDGCGMQCGCATGQTCDEGSGECIGDACLPDCIDRECGGDGCGGSCGTCPGGEVCLAGECVPGNPCSTDTDCEVGVEACDPATLQCVEACFGDSCADGQRCVVQDADSGAGACVPTCEPFVVPCEMEWTCLPLDLVGLSGVCWPPGEVGEGEACTPTDTHGDCASLLACIQGDGPDGENVCRGVCDFWGPSEAGCPMSQVCSFYGVCTEHLIPVVAAAIGEACGAGAGEICGEVDGKATGACGFDGACHELCRIGENDCPAGQTCVDEFGDGTLGLCV